MLEDISTKERIIRIIINKAVTNEGRIMLTNQEDYRLDLQAGLLMNNTISDKDNPFLVKVSKDVIAV
jgi:hypothetical protein